MAFEPHFPGYPLCVGLARLARALGSERPYALVGVAATLLALLALDARAGRGLLGALAAALWVCSPLAASEALRPMADTLAAGLGFSGAALLLGRAELRAGRLALGAALLGAAAAAKPDHALLLAFLIRPAWRVGWRGTLAAAAGVAPFALLGALALAEGCGGWEAAWHEGQRFLSGHLTDWGGLQAPLHPRIAYALAPLGAPGRGAPLWGLLGAGALLGLGLRAPRGLRREVVCGLGPYAAWLVFGQNLAHPRHALVLLPFALLLAARGARGSARCALLGALLLCALAATGSSARSWVEGARPIDRLAEWVRAQPSGTRLYAGGSARALAYRLPAADLRRTRSLRALEADLAAEPFPPTRVFVLAAEVEGVAGAEGFSLGPLGLRELDR